jgi:hypothetical protein
MLTQPSLRAWEVPTVPCTTWSITKPYPWKWWNCTQARL